MQETCYRSLTSPILKTFESKKCQFIDQWVLARWAYMISHTQGGAFREGSDSYTSPNVSTADFRFYSRIPLSKSTQLLGGLSYNMLLSAEEVKSDRYVVRKKLTTDKLSNFVFGLGLRLQI